MVDFKLNACVCCVLLLTASANSDPRANACGDDETDRCALNDAPSANALIQDRAALTKSSLGSGGSGSGGSDGGYGIGASGGDSGGGYGRGGSGGGGDTGGFEGGLIHETSHVGNAANHTANAVENDAGDERLLQTARERKDSQSKELQSETTDELSADESAMRDSGLSLYGDHWIQGDSTDGLPLYGDAIPNGPAKQKRVDGVAWPARNHNHAARCVDPKGRRRYYLPCHEARDHASLKAIDECVDAADRQSSCSGHKSVTVAVRWDACYCNFETNDLNEDARYFTMMRSLSDQEALLAKMESEDRIYWHRRRYGVTDPSRRRGVTDPTFSDEAFDN